MVKLTYLAGAVAWLSGAADAANPRLRRQTDFSNVPFKTDGPNIVDGSGATVKLAGTNWPGHGEVMVPEGLQYQSIETIASGIKSLGMNVVRLTYSIELVDQIYDNDGNDIDLETAFTKGLGTENGTAVLDKVLANNPQFTKSTTRLEVSSESCLQKEVSSDRRSRYTTQSPRSLLTRASTSTWITTSPEASGVAVEPMVIPGGETPTSTKTTGCEAFRTWQIM